MINLSTKQFTLCRRLYKKKTFITSRTDMSFSPIKFPANFLLSKIKQIFSTTLTAHSKFQFTFEVHASNFIYKCKITINSIIVTSDKSFTIYSTFFHIKTIIIPFFASSRQHINRAIYSRHSNKSSHDAILSEIIYKLNTTKFVVTQTHFAKEKRP